MKRVTTLLFAVIGMIMAGTTISNAQVSLFSAQGGIKSTSYSVNWKSAKADSIVEIMVGYYPSQDTSTFYPIYAYMKTGNDTMQNISDTITEAKSLGGLPRGLVCIQARIKVKNIIYKSNSICNVLISDSLMRPRIYWITNPSIDSNGRVTAIVKVENGGLSTTVSTFGTSDSTKVYNTFNGSELFKKNTYTIVDNKPFTISFGTIPTQTTIACGIKAASIGGRDSITPVRSGYYVVAQPATGEITNLTEQSDRMTVESNIVGYGLQTSQFIKYWKDGSTSYKYIDTAFFSGDSIQKRSRVILGLDTNTLYWFQVYTANFKGGNWSVPLSKRTSKLVIPTTFTLVIKQCTGSNYTTGTTILGYTLTSNTTASVWQEWSIDQTFGTAQAGPSTAISGTSGEISISTDFRQSGTFYTRIKGMDSKGIQFVSNTMTIKLGNWNTGTIESSNLVESKIYPNPTSGILNVPSLFGPYEIYNSMGQIIKSESIDSQIDVSIFPSGMYFIKSEKTTQRFLKN